MFKKNMTIEDIAAFIGAASAAQAAGEKKFKLGDKEYPVTISKDVAKKVREEDVADFIGAASAAKSAGKTKFKFGDKEYPVTISDKVAKAVKEGKMPCVKCEGKGCDMCNDRGNLENAVKDSIEIKKQELDGRTKAFKEKLQKLMYKDQGKKDLSNEKQFDGRQSAFKEKLKKLGYRKEDITTEEIFNKILEERWEVRAGKHAIGSLSYDDKEIINVDKKTAAKLQAYFKKTNDGKAWREIFQGLGKGKDSVEDQKSFNAYAKRLVGEDLDEASKEGTVRIIDLGNKAQDKIRKELGVDKLPNKGFQVQVMTKGKFVNQGKPYKTMKDAEKVRSTGQHSMRFDEAKSATGYELYHKDFSSAMKHAYDHAKKKLGIEIDPDEIDDKVAMGPKKPSNGKTNSYRLMGTDKKGKSRGVQIQVANLDNKRYELNMYKEEVELGEGEFKPHMMYDPKTGKGYKAENPEDHERMKKLGYSHETPEMNEAMKNTHALIDTANGNKVVAMASSEKGVKQSRASAELPPMSIKNKNTLKIVTLTKPQSQKESEKMIGRPLPSNMDKFPTNVSASQGKRMGEELLATIRAKHKQEEVQEASSKAEMVEGMKMNDPKLLRVFDKLKKGSTVKIKHDSALEKGKDFIEYIVKSKNMVRNGTVEKITLARKDSPTSAKRYLYKRDGGVTMAFGDMAVSPVDIKEEITERAPKIKGSSPKMKNGIIYSIRGKNGKVYDVELQLDRTSIKFRTLDDMGAINTISLGQAARIFEELETISEKKYSTKQYKMAFGVLNDPRWKGGNMTQIIGTIEKIAKGLSDDPAISKAIQLTNEDLQEGTWAFADKSSEVTALKKLMSKPITLGKEGDDATEVLYSLLGDDELFDDLADAGKKNPKGDARPVIKNWFKQRIKDNSYGMGKDAADLAKKLGLKEEAELFAESIIDDMRDIVDNKQAKKIKGTIVDLFTASAVVQIYDKVNDSNKSKMEKLPLPKLVDLAYKIMKREEINEINIIIENSDKKDAKEMEEIVREMNPKYNTNQVKKEVEQMAMEKYGNKPRAKKIASYIK